MKKFVLAVVITSLTVVGCMAEKPPNSTNTSILEEQKDSKNQSVTFGNGLIELQFPVGWYKNESEHPYDLQYFSKNQNMNTGVFLYKSEDLSKQSTPQRIFERQIDDLKSKRKNFTIIEPKQTENLGDKTITTAVYSGERNVSRYYYKFTLVEFADNREQFLVALQVAIPSEWSQSQPILEEITRSARVVSTERV